MTDFPSYADLIYEYENLLDLYVDEVLSRNEASREVATLVRSLTMLVRSGLHQYDIKTIERMVASLRLSLIAQFPHLRDRVRGEG